MSTLGQTLYRMLLHIVTFSSYNPIKYVCISTYILPLFYSLGNRLKLLE